MGAIKTQAITKCVHCGENCTEQIVSNDLSFCCIGCQTVYELFQNCDLEGYYDLNEHPGVSLQSIREDSYAFLNESEVADALIDFADEETSSVRFYIPAIHCSSCLWLLENLYRLDDGIERSTVNFLKKEVRIIFNHQKTSLQKIAAKLHQIGYQPEINLSNLSDNQRNSIDKSLYYKIGLTGFLFGNIMLFSFPEYLGLNKTTDSFYFTLFGCLNLVLALPLLFYSATDYLKSAFIGLQQKHLNIDLPISIGILALFGRSGFEILTHQGAGYLDALAGLIFFLLVGKWFQQRTYHQISFDRNYESYFPVAATVIKNGQSNSVSLKKLKPGDVIQLRNGELIPADGILKTGNGAIDYSFVTGESESKSVLAGESVYAGGRQKGGLMTIILTKPVVESYLVQLWNDHAFQEKRTAASAGKTANLVGKYFTIFILTVALITLAYWLPKDSALAINAFTSVLIIACPCAVALAIPFTYGNVMRLLAEQEFFLKDTNIIEAIQEVNYIVFDKTGTLTERKAAMNFYGNLVDSEPDMVRSLAYQSGHLRSRQIVDFLPKGSILEVENFREEIGKGILGIVNGQSIYIGKSDKIEGTIVEINGDYRGHFLTTPILRPHVETNIQELKKSYQLALLSGDNKRHFHFFENIFYDEAELEFNQSPQEKLDFIKSLQKKGHKVMMVGDGLNDAGALQQADVGIVIAETENNFSPACDGVVSSGAFHRFSSILQKIKNARNILILCYIFALFYNIIGLSFAVQGLLSPIIAAVLMPLSSVTIVVIGVVVSTWVLRG